jgi:hypothetical protein
MARILKELKKRPPRAKYPWDKWSDGRVWLLERGKDYSCPDLSIARQAHQYATRVGLQATTSVQEDGVVVQFDKLVMRMLPRRKKK